MISVNKSLKTLKDRWFAPLPAARLGLLRVFIGIYSVWYIWTRRKLILGFANKDLDLYEPVGVLRLLPIPPDAVSVEWLVLATVFMGMMYILGIAFRYSGPAFALLLLVTLCYRNSWSMIYHMHNSLVIHVAIIGLSRSADGFSVDSWLLSSSQRKSVLSSYAWDYGWPIRLICAVTAATYFLAGFAKVVGPDGLAWASGESLRAQIAVDSIRKEVLEGGAMPMAYFLYDQIWLFAIMGIGTFLLELGAPWFALHRYSGRLWAILTFFMHWGIYLIMGIKFRYHMSFIIFLSFFPLEALLQEFKHAWSLSASNAEPQSKNDALQSQGTNHVKTR